MNRWLCMVGLHWFGFIGNGWMECRWCGAVRPVWYSQHDDSSDS